MDGTCNTHGEDNKYKMLVRKAKGKRPRGTQRQRY
jgi:hypothetical protein